MVALRGLTLCFYTEYLRSSSVKIHINGNVVLNYVYLTLAEFISTPYQ